MRIGQGLLVTAAHDYRIGFDAGIGKHADEHEVDIGIITCTILQHLLESPAEEGILAVPLHTVLEKGEQCHSLCLYRRQCVDAQGIHFGTQWIRSLHAPAKVGIFEQSLVNLLPTARVGFMQQTWNLIALELHVHLGKVVQWAPHIGLATNCREIFTHIFAFLGSTRHQATANRHIHIHRFH